jgi:hypothetical protein
MIGVVIIPKATNKKMIAFVRLATVEAATEYIYLDVSRRKNLKTYKRIHLWVSRMSSGMFLSAPLTHEAAKSRFLILPALEKVKTICTMASR